MAEQSTVEQRGLLNRTEDKVTEENQLKGNVVMHQMSNIIRINEGGTTSPYVVYERFSPFATPNVPVGFKLVREMLPPEAFLLLCAPIADAEWTDVVTDDAQVNQIPTTASSGSIDDNQSIPIV